MSMLHSSLTAEHTDPRTSTVILENRLVFCTLSRQPIDTPTAHFFTIDDVFRYEPFFNDFGPLNLNISYKFCQMLLSKLAAPEYQNKVIYYYCFNRPQNKSNAAVLIGIYQIIYGGRTSAQAYEPLKALEPYMPFRDASQGLCTFRLMPQHCLRAVAKAHKLGFFDWNNWNSAEYEHFESVENGDLNVIIPKKFVAFSGPHATNISPEGYPTLTPTDYHSIFKLFNVQTVIRLNKKCYERRDFINAGIAHHDLYFEDGGCPSQALLDKFLKICETAPATIAVHCKAGLGRTGTTIGCYIMKHYHFSAAETIAWLRICRPGCVIGPQQHYLKLQEPRMWKLGKALNGGSEASSQNSTTNSPPAATRTSSDNSTTIHHPSPTPLYANSQPTSPISNSSTPSSSSGQNSYSASFDTPPTMYQQKIQAAGGHYTRSTTTPSSSSSSSQFNSGSSLTLNAVRGRSKVVKPTSSIYSPGSTALYTEDAKDGSTPNSAPQPSRLTSTSKLMANQTKSTSQNLTPPSVQRNLFDSKVGLSPSQQRQVRSPSANGLRRGTALQSPVSPSSPGLYNTGVSFSSTLTATSSPLYNTNITVKSKPRSSSQAPMLGFRQSKSRGGAKI